MLLPKVESDKFLERQAMKSQDFENKLNFKHFISIDFNSFDFNNFQFNKKCFIDFDTFNSNIF